ncbi:MAG: hypothetical protein K8S87_03880 [Planctomycetes bacterium]|nr:hypothetical protein [Planctomycetota bacterium]
MKQITVFALVLSGILTFGCATQMNDIEFAYFSKPQTDRPGIQDVFFNDSHSAYKKFRQNPEKVIEENEKILFIDEKLPKSHHPVEDEWMEALVKSLDVQDFFEYGRSVPSFMQAIEVFRSKDFIRQCIILIVDGNVTIALSPRPPGANASRNARDDFYKKMDKFRDYGNVYVAFAAQFRRVGVKKTDSGIDVFLKDLERSHRLSEKEKEDIKENKDKREDIHGN